MKAFTLNGKTYSIGETRRLAAEARKRLRRQFNKQFQQHLPMIIYGEAQKAEGWKVDVSIAVGAPEHVLKKFNERLVEMELEKEKENMTPDERLLLAAQRGVSDPVILEEE